MDNTEKEKKWTEWSVVGTGDGALRCRRANVADEKDAEYRDSPRPSFSPEEIAAMIEFGSRGLMSAEDIAQRCYANRYRTEAFRLCRLLNGEGK